MPILSDGERRLRAMSRRAGANAVSGHCAAKTGRCNSMRKNGWNWRWQGRCSIRALTRWRRKGVLMLKTLTHLFVFALFVPLILALALYQELCAEECE